MDDRQIKLGCAQPGESVATFGDALRRLTDRATHLYVDGTRYWYSTQPSVTRLAEDRAVQIDEDTVIEHIETCLRQQSGARGQHFARVHICPGSSADVPDEMEARLVILRPTTPHSAKATDSPARREVQTILNERGAGQRSYKNTLVFLAPDRARLEELQRAVRSYLAWKSIVDEKKELLLDPFQEGQATTKRDSAQLAVQKRIPETYIWLLSPYLPDHHSTTIEWEEIRMQGDDGLAPRAGKKLEDEGKLITFMAGTVLRLWLDRIPLWRGDDVPVRQLWDDLCRYLYLPRLRDQSVLVNAIAHGVSALLWASETFAYADARDEATGKYRGLRAGDSVNVMLDGNSRLVKPEVAEAQLRVVTTPAGSSAAGRSSTETSVRDQEGDGYDAVTSHGGPSDTAVAETEPAASAAERYYGQVELSPLRMASEVSEIAASVVQHLESVLGSGVRITLEIEGSFPEGVPGNVKMTVLENGRTLRFNTQGFENE